MTLFLSLQLKTPTTEPAIEENKEKEVQKTAEEKKNE